MAQQKGILRIKLSGARQIAKNLRIAEELVLRELGKAVYAEARQIMDEAGGEVPKGTRALYNSRYVAPPSRTSAEIKITCGFGTQLRNPVTGQPTAEYANIVHERLDVKHPNGKAKFLEDPMNRAAPGLLARVSQRIRSRLK